VSEKEVERWDDGEDRLGHEMAELVGRLSEEDMDRETRGRLLGRIVRLTAASARRAGAAGVGRGRWLTDTVMEIAPHVPVRDLETLSVRRPAWARRAERSPRSSSRRRRSC
jgi:hypothetical protein